MTEIRAASAGLHGDRIADASSVLLLAQTLGEAETAACRDLSAGVSRDRGTALAITFTESPTDRLALWRRRNGRLPARFGVVSVGSRTVTRDAGDPDDTRLGIETVGSPGDLTGIGIAVNELVDEWAGEPDRLVVCFDSVTVLLQYVDLQRAFRFLHVLTGRLEDAGAVAHYHMDPNAHEQRTLKTLRPLFDAVAEVPNDGTEPAVGPVGSAVEDDGSEK